MSEQTPDSLALSKSAKLTGEACKCQDCKLIFGGESGFNDHRVGDFGPVSTRRCRTAQEIFDRGWRLGTNGRISKPLSEAKLAKIKSAQALRSGI